MTGTATIILGSAAIGALVSTCISSCITFASQVLERRSRRREVLLTKSIELAMAQVKFFQDSAVVNQERVPIYPFAVYARINYKHLKSLYENERLTDQLEEKFAEIISDHRTTGANKTDAPK
jgi:hypothetical protein